MLHSRQFGKSLYTPSIPYIFSVLQMWHLPQLVCCLYQHQYLLLAKECCQDRWNCCPQSFYLLISMLCVAFVLFGAANLHFHYVDGEVKVVIGIGKTSKMMDLLVMLSKDVFLAVCHNTLVLSVRCCCHVEEVRGSNPRLPNRLQHYTFLLTRLLS